MPDTPVRPPLIINLESQSRQRDLIDTAAKRVGLTSSDFVIEVACRKAEEIVLDQIYFPLTDQAFVAFTNLLHNPPAPSTRLCDLMGTKAPWE
ncbi:MAG: DUF1778 domain-containing protein [Planctomycetes bacterium]|nr:DUF1778 domain-containing protein [Planctomycetota bacterium]